MIASLMTQIAEKDFSRATLRALARNGVAIISSQVVPDESGSAASGSVAYLVAINGQGRIRTHAEVLALAQ